MRRGDFVGIGWSPINSAKGHIEKIVEKLNEGIEVMRSHGVEEEDLPKVTDP